jgi:hypothetical protein
MVGGWWLMVGVGPNIDCQVVTYLPRTHTPQNQIDGPATHTSRSSSARTEEEGLELVHARVGEEERGVVVRHHGGGRPVRVLPLLHEVVDERLPHAPRWPLCFPF